VTGFLLDTNVISLLAPTKAQTVPGFPEWLESMDSQGRVFLSVVTIHEIERGIAQLEARGATKKAGALRSWLDGLVSTFVERILPIDLAVGRISGSLEARAIAVGHDPGMADCLIAGTAIVHDLTIITDNIRDFVVCGVSPVRPGGAIHLA